MAHHDVKAANVLIDAAAGGRLLLADFGAALRPGEEAVGFTASYASPELLASHALDDYADLRPDKVDAYSLGAVLYELLLCRRLEEVSAGETLAHFIADGPGLAAAMDLGHLALPWLPPDAEGLAPYVGYTQRLKNLVMKFLNPNANERLLPGQLQVSSMARCPSPNESLTHMKAHPHLLRSMRCVTIGCRRCCCRTSSLPAQLPQGTR